VSSSEGYEQKVFGIFFFHFGERSNNTNLGSFKRQLQAQFLHALKPSPQLDVAALHEALISVAQSKRKRRKRRKRKKKKKKRRKISQWLAVQFSETRVQTILLDLVFMSCPFKNDSSVESAPQKKSALKRNLKEKKREINQRIKIDITRI